jgi:hypothetical protein
MTAAMWTFEEASARLYRAMAERRAAKTALREYRERVGECEHALADESGMFGDACYRRAQNGRISADEWCDVCAGSQPLWECYRDAARAQGQAVRTFMAVGQRTVVQA